MENSPRFQPGEIGVTPPALSPEGTMPDRSLTGDRVWWPVHHADGMAFKYGRQRVPSSLTLRVLIDPARGRYSSTGR